MIGKIFSKGRPAPPKMFFGGFSHGRSMQQFDEQAIVPNFQLQLSEGSEVKASLNMDEKEHTGSDVSMDIASVPADKESVDRLLSRVALLDEEMQDPSDFFKRDSSLPAPKTGSRIQTAFPPSDTKLPSIDSLNLDQLRDLGKAEAGEVKIIRSTPTSGNLNTAAPNIKIVFNQPMVPLSTIGDIQGNASNMIASLTPKIEGKWSWLSPTILQFEPVYRLSYATKYTVVVSKGATSVLGNTLLHDFSLEFSTPAPKVTTSIPHHIPDSLQPIILLKFDQPINPDKILEHSKLTHKQFLSSVHHPIAFANKEEIQKKFQYLASTQIQDWVAFKPTQDLPKDTEFRFTLERATISSEGPIEMSGDHSWTFSTYGPLRLQSTNQPQNIEPGGTWMLRFSNNLKHSSIHKKSFTINPEIEFSLQHTDDSDTVLLNPKSIEKSRYTVTVSPGYLEDVFNQTLNEKESVSITTREYPSLIGNLEGPSGSVIIMDPIMSKDPYFPITVYNYDELRVQIFSVKPENLTSDINLYDHIQQYRTNSSYDFPGVKKSDEIIHLNVQRDEPYRYQHPLKRFLQVTSDGDFVGHVLIVVEPTENSWRKMKPFNDAGFDKYGDRTIICSWMQCTKLSLDSFSYGGSRDLAFWATELASGKPVSDATIFIPTLSDQVLKTDANGIVSTYFKATPSNQAFAILTHGIDSTFIRVNTDSFYNVNEWSWWVFDDRNLFKPKETVRVKGYLRHLAYHGSTLLPEYKSGKVKYRVNDSRNQKFIESEVTLNEFGAFDISFTLPDNINLGHANAVFSFEPLVVSATDSISTSNRQNFRDHYYSFRVEEFRKPEYEVSSNYRPTTTQYSHSSRPSTVIATAEGKLFAGGALSDAQVTWRVAPSTSSYSPPGWNDFRFGEHRHWFCGFYSRSFGNNNHYINYQQSHFIGKTDSSGRHDLKIEFHGIEETPKPIMVEATATIMDLNNQAQDTRTSFLVHPSHYYVGFQLKEMFGTKKQRMHGKIIVADVEGKLVNNVTVTIDCYGKGQQLIENESGVADWKDVTDAQTISVKSNMDTPTDFEFVPEIGGTYSLTFKVVDEDGRPNESKYLQMYIAGGSQQRTSEKMQFVGKDMLTILADKEEYKSNETAKLIVPVPFSPAKGLLIIAVGNRLVRTEMFEIEPNQESATLMIALQDEWIPHASAQVLIVGSKPRSGSSDSHTDSENQPAIAEATHMIQISREIFKLDVEITPRKDDEQALPGDTIHMKVGIKLRGKPMKDAEVVLIAVDESVLALSGYSIPDPLSIFYPRTYSSIQNTNTRTQCLLANFEDLEELKKRMHLQAQASYQTSMAFTSFSNSGSFSAFGMKQRAFAPTMPAPTMMMMRAEANLAISSDMVGATTNAQDSTIAVRSNFDPSAAFVTHAITDSNGYVEIPVKLPDSLTRYRIWATAAHQRLFGLAESSITVQLPVMVRPSPPRFLNFGDNTDLSVVLQNQYDREITILIAARTTSNIRIPDGQHAFRITIPPIARRTVTFPIVADVKCGNAQIQFVVTTENGIRFNDAIEVSFPVFTPSTSEAFVIYGDFADTEVVIQPFQKPTGVIPQFGSLDITTTTTAVASLTDAFIYLYQYPFECTEQISSRILGILSLYDVLKAFNVSNMPTEYEIHSKLMNDIATLKSRQHANGGFGFWVRGIVHDPFVSVHTAHALILLQKKNIANVTVDQSIIAKAMSFLTNIETNLNDWSWPSFKFPIIAYALYVRSQNGDNVSAEALKLLKSQEFEKFSFETLAWLLVALASSGSSHQHEASTTKEMEMIANYFQSHVEETAETATFISQYDDDGSVVLLHSARRTDAIILEALLHVDPLHSLAPKIAKGLQAHKKAGKWQSTQENCWILLALNHYFNIFEREVPHLVARSWYDDKVASVHTFEGRTTDTKFVSIPMQNVLDIQAQSADIVLQREGVGRLYYRFGLNYAPSSLQLSALNRGFAVQRTYVGADDPSSVTFVDGKWIFKVGQRIRVTLTLTTATRRYHIALVDYLAAGCESLNTALKTTLIGDSESDRIRPSPNQPFGFGGYFLPSPGSYNWYEHQQLRDERTEVFASILSAGVYEYSYYIRATATGDYIIPPAKAEEMYSPEIFGRTSTEHVSIRI